MATRPPRKEPAAPAAAEPAAAPAATPAKPRKSRAKLLVLAALLIVLAGGGALAWYVLQPAPAHGKRAAPPAPAKPAVYMNLEPFTVNLEHAPTEQYLQVGVALRLGAAAYEHAITAQMPEIRNRVLLLLSGKRAEDIATPAGKQQLSGEIRNQVVQALAGRVPPAGVQAVLFTSFVIQ